MVGSDILIYRLVYNLVENAIKYNHSGGQVTVTAYGRKNMFICPWRIQETESLRNSGNACLNHSFVWINPEAELGGVGLGLALVREIVRVHDGSITVRSNPFGGTVFDVILPL